MAFNKNVKLDKPSKNANPYLSDEEKGFALAVSIINNNFNAHSSNIDEILNKMSSSCDRLTLQDNSFNILKQLVELLKNPLKYSLFNEYTIIGIGGAFNSGKSAVLNSIVGSDPLCRLPEDNGVCTSVPTYIRNKAETDVIVCSKNGNEDRLGAQELDAVSHKFRKEYNFNIAPYIDFISIGTPSFSLKNIALLDTPGYNAQDNTVQGNKDRERALGALSSVDYLVWLISAKEPVLSETDKAFIKSLNLSRPVIVIVNRCDMRELFKSECPEKSSELVQIKKDFANAGIPFEFFIPYSARFPTWNNCRENLLKVFNTLGSKKNVNRYEEAETILKKLDKEFLNLIRYYDTEIGKLNQCIDNSGNPCELQTVVQLRGVLGTERIRLQFDYSQFKKYAAEFLEWIKMQAKGC